MDKRPFKVSTPEDFSWLMGIYANVGAELGDNGLDLIQVDYLCQVATANGYGRCPSRRGGHGPKCVQRGYQVFRAITDEILSYKATTQGDIWEQIWVLAKHMHDNAENDLVEVQASMLDDLRCRHHELGEEAAWGAEVLAEAEHEGKAH